MQRRTLTLLVLVVTSACSQRSPWVPAPPTPSPGVTVSQQGSGLMVKGQVIALPASSDPVIASYMGDLAFPVAGYENARLDDSYLDPRDGGSRRHQAIDIMAPRGTPVLAVQSGRVLRLSKTSKGGISLYATDDESKYVYYYAHLDRYHSRMSVGRSLARGDTIGFVGSTGNASESAPHLHFQVMRMPSDGRYWNGEPINPYPLLRATRVGAEP